jgi:hypothetical protein
LVINQDLRPKTPLMGIFQLVGKGITDMVIASLSHQNHQTPRDVTRSMSTVSARATARDTERSTFIVSK